jgi:integrase
MSLIRVPGSPYFHVVLIVNGKRYQKSAKTASRAQAKAFESKWHNELLRQAASGEAEAITLAEASRLFLATHKDNVNFSNLRAHCNRFVEHFGKQTDLAAITTTDFNRFLAKLAEEFQPGTINQIAQQFRQLVTETAALGYATPRIDYPKRLKVKQKTRVFSPEEEAALLSHLASSPRLRESYDLAVFLLDTGARINEALTTTWDDVDLEGRRLRIIRHKTKTQTILGITNRLHAVLTRRFQKDTHRPGNSYVFKNGDASGHRRYSDAAIKRAFAATGINSAENVARLGKATIHTFRHHFISKLTANGLSPQQIMKLSGHASVSSLMRYSHLNQDEVLAKALEILNEG